MANKENAVVPRNKNGKTNSGIPYRYGQSEKSTTLRSDKIDLTVLTKNEMKLLNLLKGKMTVNGKKIAKQLTIIEMQEAIFSAKSYANYGTSDTRNLLRRLRTTGMIKTCAARGAYALTDKGAAHLAKGPAKPTKKKAPAKKKKPVAKKKKAPAKKKAAKKKAA